jgi:DNA-binding CsgD family transcriptional regulator/PAS domain-containing protein
MLTAEDLSEVVGLIYRAGVDAALWPTALRRVAAAVRSESAIVQQIDLTTLLPRGSLSVGRDGDFERSMQVWSPRNCFIPRSRHLPSGSVSADYMLLPRREFLQTEFYHQWFRPQEIAWTIACNIEVNVDDMTHLVLGRHGSRATAFGKDDMRLLRLLNPHLREAMRLHGRLTRQNANLQERSDILDRCAAGIVVADAAGRIVLLNAAGERILSAADGLQMRGRALSAADAAVDRQLRSLIARAASNRGLPTGGAITVEREKAARPLAVSVVPLRGAEDWLLPATEHALLILAETDTEMAASPAPLRQLFGLTPGEAKVALSLASGKDPGEIAAELDLSVATVRTHLQRVFEKTRTNRQPELVALLYRVLGPFQLQ